MNSTNLKREKQKRLFFNIVIFILIFFMAIRIPLDTDFWWHIRAGQLTVENRSPINVDMNSFTVFQSPWINHSWLSQVLFFLVYDFLGLSGTMLFVAVLATLSILFVFMRLKSNSIVNGFVILFCVITTAVVWSPRPQLITLLFFSILVYLISEKEVLNTKKYYFILPILFMIWGNLHAGFSIGIIFILSLFLGKFVDYLLAVDHNKTLKLIEIRNLFLLIIASVLIVLINPNGMGIWKVQFNTISLPSLQNLIPEWASPNFHELYQQPFLWLWLLIIFFILANRTKYDFSVIIPFVILGGLGFLSRRNFVYFSIFSIPILCIELDNFYNNYLKPNLGKYKIMKNISLMNKTPNRTLSKIINLLFVGFLAFITIGKIVYLSSTVILDSYEKQNFPKLALQELKKNNHLPLQCLNSYTWGGYQSWFYPDLKIFIDGRTDLYGELIIQDWIEMVNGGKNWKEKINFYKINCVILENDRPIIQFLDYEGWETYYKDDIVSVLLIANE